MKVLLVPQKSNYPDPRPCLDIFGQAFPYIAAALKKGGHEVFGMSISNKWCHGSAPLTLEISLRNAIDKYKPDLLGVGGLSADYRFVRDAILFIRQIAPDIPIVCGGGLITYDLHYIFPNLHPDFAVIGEGEETIVALADCIEKGNIFDDIKNIAFWKDGKPVYTTIEDTNKNLDVLPLPDYSHFDYDIFLEYLNQADNNFYAHSRHNPRVMPITLGRSCPFECTFCCHTTGPKYRERSIDNAIEEIIYFYEKYKFNILFIYDELFVLRKERILEFCRKIKKLKNDTAMDFDWTCNLRVPYAERDILKEMKESGCIFIGYGFESASPKVLNSMKKQITVEQIINAIKLTEEASLGIQGNFIIGDPVETEETIQETKNFFKTWCTDSMINFNYLAPYPGSEIFQYCIDNGIINDKQRYYNNIGRIGMYKINMTKIPDEIFFKLVDGICDITAPWRCVLLKLKETPALSCEKIGPFKPDLDAPVPLRRLVYKIKAICPHCQNKIDYVYPMRVTTLNYPEHLQLYCAQCHKRFILNIPRETLELTEGNPIESFYSFKSINSFLGYNIRSYKGHYIFDNVVVNYIYAIPHHLQDFDIMKAEDRNRPEVIKAKTLPELERLIEERNSQPKLLDVYKGYNFVWYDSHVFAMSRALGDIDLTRETEVNLKKYQKNKTCVIGKSLNETKHLLDQLLCKTLQAESADKK